MEWTDVLDFFGALLILFGSTALMMLLCLGVITIVPAHERKKTKKKEKK